MKLIDILSSSIACHFLSSKERKENPKGLLQQVIQANMSVESVSFSRTLNKSSVSVLFQLVLPKKFCDAHLPRHDNDVVLVDETGREHTLRFLTFHNKLGSGWRKFAKAHSLLEGDKLSFHLIDQCKFKVHITRASKVAENEFQNNRVTRASKVAENEFQNIVPVGFGKRKDLAEEITCFGNTVTKNYVDSFVVDGHQKDAKPCQNKKRVHVEIVSKEKEPDFKGSVSYENSESAFSFKSFEDFKIYVNGETLDSKIPKDVRLKYYQLCRGQKKCIHDHAVKGLDGKFAVAVILEIVRIADSTKAATISTSPDDLVCMEKTLQSFEDLGFAVGSLRAKLSTLTKFLTEHKTVEESTRVRLAEIEAVQEQKSKIDKLIECAMAQYGELIGNLEMKIDALKERREKLGFVFQKVAALTW